MTTSSCSISQGASWRKANTAHLPGGIITHEHFFRLPLDHNNTTASPKIDVFVRELVASNKDPSNTPYLLYLQGGPGFASPRVAINSGWIKRALKDFRILLLDQRGTGRSNPILLQTLAPLPPSKQFSYLLHFRAESIVKDCEAIRQTLLPPGKKWTVLGQSFGGFCLMTYLSIAPEGVEAGIFTGGIPPIGKSAEEVYLATFHRVAAMNAKYYARYPGDIELVRDIVARLKNKPEPLPSGGILTARRFIQLGICLGSGSGLEDLHYLMEEAFVTIPEPASSSASPPPRREFSYKFLRGVESWQAFDTNPLYALLHEAIYCEGKGMASRWAAERVINRPEMAGIFDIDRMLKEADPTDQMSISSSQQQVAPTASGDSIMPTTPPQIKPILFTGEHIFPFMFDALEEEEDGRMDDGEEGNQNDVEGQQQQQQQKRYIYKCLGPLREVAHMLAQYDGWGPLYDPAVLRRNTIPCAAIIYWADIFVERSFSEETAQLFGNNAKLWLTSEYAHSGIRDDGFHILDRLLGMLRGEAQY